mmetsp:Transcript_26762/g.62550  ORF Transcript_26762/g.62550 Transcript_26762/m.62550 type:complete len:241 (-) Transcript_26762:901-1623(-)
MLSTGDKHSTMSSSPFFCLLLSAWRKFMNRFNLRRFSSSERSSSVSSETSSSVVVSSFLSSSLESSSSAFGELPVQLLKDELCKLMGVMGHSGMSYELHTSCSVFGVYVLPRVYPLSGASDDGETLSGSELLGVTSSVGCLASEIEGGPHRHLSSDFTTSNNSEFLLLSFRINSRINFSCAFFFFGTFFCGWISGSDVSAEEAFCFLSYSLFEVFDVGSATVPSSDVSLGLVIIFETFLS